MAITPSFGGSLSGETTDRRGLFLKVFSGEVMTAFERAVKISPLITNRTITSGKSAQFPSTGVAAARYFQPGDSLLGAVSGTPAAGDEGSSGSAHPYLSTIKQSERVIHIDGLLTASCFIDELDEAMSHYDYRQAFATELGRAIARHQDSYALYSLYASSQDVGNQSGETTPGGPQDFINDPDFLTSATSCLDSIYAAAEALDVSDVPAEDRCVVMGPKSYYTLLKAGVFSVGGVPQAPDARPQVSSGARAEGGMTIGGMPVIVSNAPGFSTDTTEGGSAGNGAFFTDTKGGDSTAETHGIRNIATLGSEGQTALVRDDVVAMVFHKSAVGCVKLKDLSMESEYLIERQGTLMVAKMAQGMGALRNDAVVTILDAA